jgi:prepilin-type N-terminal cleavage/methylation domain-containing protein
LAVRRTAGKTGFTLVELLIVIAVLSLLITLLSPVLRQAKELTYRASCATNLRRLNHAFQLYAYDCGNLFPQTGIPGDLDVAVNNWRPAVAEDLRYTYLGGELKAFACPSYDARWGYTEDVWQAQWSVINYGHATRATNYVCMASFLMNPASWPGYQRDGINFQVVRTSDTPTMVLLADMVHFAGYWEGGVWTPCHGGYEGATGGNLLYLDGAVRWKDFADMELNYWFQSTSYGPYYW